MRLVFEPNDARRPRHLRAECKAAVEANGARRLDQRVSRLVDEIKARQALVYKRRLATSERATQIDSQTLQLVGIDDGERWRSEYEQKKRHESRR